MPAPRFLTSRCPRSPAPLPVPTLPPDPAPAGRQQRQAECQEQPQAGARHGPGERGWWHQGQGSSRAAPTASRARGTYDLAPAGGRRRKARAWGRRLDPGAGPGEGRPAPGHPGVQPRPAARGQRLKINSGKCIPRLGKEKWQGKEAAGQPARPASLPGPGGLDLTRVPGPIPLLEASVRSSVARPDYTGSSRSRDPESLVTHLGGERTSGLCT